MKAKTVSIIGKVLSILFLFGIYIGILVWNHRVPTADETTGMLMVSIFIATSFLPVDVSVIIENVKKLK